MKGHAKWTVFIPLIRQLIQNGVHKIIMDLTNIHISKILN